VAVKIAEVTVPKVHARTHLTEVKVASSLTHPNVVCGPHLVALCNWRINCVQHTHVCTAPVRILYTSPYLTLECCMTF
jgi:hypothetical protein